MDPTPFLIFFWQKVKKKKSKKGGGRLYEASSDEIYLIITKCLQETNCIFF